jgi:hypothetical protein
MGGLKEPPLQFERGRLRLKRILVVSGSYQNYQNGELSNQLIGREAEHVGQRLFNYIDDNAQINQLLTPLEVGHEVDTA